MVRFLKLLIGLALIPACWAVSTATFDLYRLSGGSTADGMIAWALPIGFVLWAAIYFLLPRPTRTYVFGHELTHALWALMMGGRVGELKVGRSGGHVEVTRTNFVITLAPYFFPFYCFLVIGVYYLADIWLDVAPYKAWWLGAVGFTWAFHVTFTITMLTERQPDIQEHGRVFSWVLIYIFNLAGVGLWVVCTTKAAAGAFFVALAANIAGCYAFGLHFIARLLR